MTPVVLIAAEEFTPELQSIKTLQRLARLSLAPAKRAVDSCLAGSPTDVSVPTEAVAELVGSLVALGWTLEVAGQRHRGSPQPVPAWRQRRAGTAEVIRHTRTEPTFRLVVRPDCTMNLHDELVVVFPRNFPVGAEVRQLQPVQDGVRVELAVDDPEERELLVCLFRVGQVLDVLSAEPA